MSTETNDSGGSNEVDQTKLASMLDQEIERMFRKKQRTGWTKRAVVVGIGTLLWLLIDLVGNSGWNGQRVGMFYVTGLVIFEATQSSLVLLEAILGHSKDGLRFRLLPDYYPDVLRMTLSALLYILIAGMMVNIGELIPAWLKWLTLLWCAYHVLASVGAALMVRFAEILPERESVRGSRLAKYVKWPAVARIIITGALAVGFVWRAWHIGVMQSPDELKISGLMLAMTYLGAIYVKSKTGRPLLGALKRLRRELALGDIEFERAREQARLILLGVKGATIVQEDVKAMSALTEKLTECGDAVEEAARVVDLMERGRGSEGEHDLNGGTELMTRATELVGRGNAAGKYRRKIDAQWKKATVKAVMVYAMSPKQQAQVSEVHSQVGAAVEQWRRYSKRVAKRAEEIHERLGRLKGSGEM